MYIFDEVNIDKIKNKFGEEFYLKTKSLIKPCIDKWGINNLELIESFSANLVFKGDSVKLGPVVIKFGRNKDEFNSEVAALRSFDNNSSCELFEVDQDNLILLEECIEPGTTLDEEKQLQKRLVVFCNLYRHLHLSNELIEDEILSDENFKYKSYKDWIFRITEFMVNQDDWHEVSKHMIRAKALFIEVSKEYVGTSLLHGDFHYYNILKSETGYKIIDPKGVLGHPIFDLPRYMLNEFWDEEDDALVDVKMENVFNTLSENLSISKEILAKLLYIEGVMANCWNIEDGTSIENKDEILETIEWLEKYLAS